jgi:hypothetical protein
MLSSLYGSCDPFAVFDGTPDDGFRHSEIHGGLGTRCYIARDSLIRQPYQELAIQTDSLLWAALAPIPRIRGHDLSAMHLFGEVLLSL